MYQDFEAKVIAKASTVKLAIVGSRYFSDYDVVAKHVKEYIDSIGAPSMIISGGATGVDSLAVQYADKYEIPKLVFKPQWGKYGKAAGPIRNKLIVNECTHLIAFMAEDSVGTKDTVEYAKSVNRPMTIVNI